MQTLTYGRKLPQTGDRGSVFFEALEDNILRDDAHSHNGTDSPKLNSANIHSNSVLISSGSWQAVGDRFYQDITLPLLMEFDKCVITLRLEDVGNPGHGHILMLDQEKKSATSFTVYTNDSSINVRAYFSS